jgi:hypothetical protein
VEGYCKRIADYSGLKRRADKKKGNDKTLARGVIQRYHHLGFPVLFDSSRSTLRQWLPISAESRHQLPLYNATRTSY